MNMREIQQFTALLEKEDRSEGTVEKYRRDVRAFAAEIGRWKRPPPGGSTCWSGDTRL